MRVCDYCGAEFEPRTQGKPGRFCPGTDHRRLYYKDGGREYAQVLKRRRAAAKQTPVDFDEARRRPEFQEGVAEILARAEVQRPATLEAWGIKTIKAA